MATYPICSMLILLGVFLISPYKVNGASLGAMEVEEQSLKDLQTKNLLDEVDKLEAVEEELFRREEIAELREELEEILQEDRKRQLRQTPAPEVKRLKMTPPPNVPEPMYRFAHTPIPPSDTVRRPDPEYPYNLVDKPLRQTPRPLRITPQPYVRPAVYPQETADKISYEQEMAQELWDQIYEKNLLMDRRAEERKQNERERRTQLSIGFINKPYERRVWAHK